MKTTTILKARCFLKRVSLLLIAMVSFLLSQANIYTVTSTANTGAGTLRQAITDANAHAGLDTIRFNIGTSGNLFESSGSNTWPVIEISSVLPTITDPLLIDGYSQPDGNTGSIAGKVVGADNFTQGSINYPDVYITVSSSYSLPNGTNSINGNGLNISTTNTTIRGICMSGFGNTSTNSSTASSNGEIAVLRKNPAVNNSNIVITDCFISCDPRGAYPTVARRRSKGSGILVMGNVFDGLISRNYVAHSGTYGIHYNGGYDPQSVGPTQSGNTVNLQNRSWTITENQVVFGGTNTTTTTTTRSADAINLMHCRRFVISYNYVEDPEQVGIDIGYNADSNYVYNNSLTGFVNTSLAAPLVCIRIGLNSKGDSLVKNHIYNNTSAQFKAGIWIDRSGITTTGVTSYDNSNNYIGENVIHDNNASAIVLSTNIAAVNARFNTISRNSTYNNAGLGIDLNYTNTTGPTAVTTNDNNDADNGVNDLQNFPLIDSARNNGFGYIVIWGKAPAGSTLEFFGTDGGVNNHGGRTLNYGEGQYYIGTGVEGSADDGRSGTNPSNVALDGNIGNTGTLSLFRFIFLYTGPPIDVNSVSGTATLNGNTSEFGPIAPNMLVLGGSLFDFNANYADNKTNLYWEALCDDKFASFILEKSSNNIDFTRLTELYPAIQAFASTATQNFDFTDFNPYEGNNFYRLKIVNKDGSFKYSKTIRINTGSTIKLKLSPNPFVSDINLSVSMTKNETVSVILSDVIGRTIMTRQFKGHRGLNVFNVNSLDRLPKGQYLITLTYDGEIHTERVTKN